jgi:hypothetical protein
MLHPPIFSPSVLQEHTFAHRALLFCSLLLGYNLPALQNYNMKQKKDAEK